MMDKISACKKFRVDAGRSIVCNDTNEELFTISPPDEEYCPTGLDAMAHYIVDTLNERKDFKEFYTKYIR